MIVIRKNELKEKIIKEVINSQEGGAMMCAYLSGIIDEAFYKLFEERDNILIGVEKDVE